MKLYLISFFAISSAVGGADAFVGSQLYPRGASTALNLEDHIADM